MNRYQKLLTRIEDGEKILIDGATGTEMQRNGVPQLTNAWNGGGALTHPNILKDVHKKYILAGSEVIISNTFATHRQALHDAKVVENFKQLNHRGIEIATQARAETEKTNVLVAGGVSYWSWLETPCLPELNTLEEDVRDQVRIMADAGADLIMLEMMVDIKRTIVCLEAAQSCGLPTWVGLSCKPNKDGEIMLGVNGGGVFAEGEPLHDALEVIDSYNIPVVNIMHTEVEDISACINVIHKIWPSHFGVYAHSAQWSGSNDSCIFDGTISPHDYSIHARRWLQDGAQIIGSCCGTNVKHIDELKLLLQTSQ